MNILVTAGNTQAMIDRVRCITNIFTGRTGAALAFHAWQRGHHVHLLTSHPEALPAPASQSPGFPDARWRMATYRTFDDLERLLAHDLTSGRFDAVFHAAAVSDYLAAGVFAPAADTRFDGKHWLAEGSPTLVDRAAGKVKSDEAELWIRLTRAPKLVDRFREPWGFKGRLVKFKLEVGKSDVELEAIAEASRRQSRADFIVANTLEEAADWALIGPLAGGYERVMRTDLSRRLIDLVEA